MAIKEEGGPRNSDEDRIVHYIQIGMFVNYAERESLHDYTLDEIRALRGFHTIPDKLRLMFKSDKIVDQVAYETRQWCLKSFNKEFKQMTGEEFLRACLNFNYRLTSHALQRKRKHNGVEGVTLAEFLRIQELYNFVSDEIVFGQPFPDYIERLFNWVKSKNRPPNFIELEKEIRWSPEAIKRVSVKEGEQKLVYFNAWLGEEYSRRKVKPPYILRKRYGFATINKN